MEEFTEPENWRASILQTQAKDKSYSQGRPRRKKTPDGILKSRSKGPWGSRVFENRAQQNNGGGDRREGWTTSLKYLFLVEAEKWTGKGGGVGGVKGGGEDEAGEWGSAIPAVECWSAAWEQKVPTIQTSPVEELVVLSTKFPVLDRPRGSVCYDLTTLNPKHIQIF